jgi:hypothetical protein
MATRRTSNVELCFDSMTDLITNLAGGLILLVLLLLGVTREASSQSPPPPAVPEGTRDAGEKTVRPLRNQINLLRAEIAAIEQDVKGLEAQLPVLSQQVKELIEKAGQVQPPKERKEEKEETKEPTMVEFRPPLRRVSSKDTNVAFVCEQDRVYIFDLDAYGQARKDRKLQKGETLQVASGDYDVTIIDLVELSLGNQLLQIPRARLVRKVGRQGESVQSLRDPQSAFQARLNQLDPDKSVLQFQVYPDSFLVFRDARSLAWEKKFDLGWIPKEAGSSIEVGAGRAGAD